MISLSRVLQGVNRTLRFQGGESAPSEFDGAPVRFVYDVSRDAVQSRGVHVSIDFPVSATAGGGVPVTEQLTFAGAFNAAAPDPSAVQLEQAEADIWLLDVHAIARATSIANLLRTGAAMSIANGQAEAVYFSGKGSGLSLNGVATEQDLLPVISDSGTGDFFTWMQLARMPRKWAPAEFLNMVAVDNGGGALSITYVLRLLLLPRDAARPA